MTWVVSQGIVVFFVLISLVHVYWAAGGQWAIEAVVPQVKGGEDGALRPAFKPSALATSAVAVALLVIAGLVSLRAGLFMAPIRHWALQWLISAIAMLMFARAIGDSNQVGFFKEKVASTFARLDTLVYSPLCLILGAGLLVIAWV
ncbi:DUF3995 domain-containing protein [Pseudomonas purpurea]|uniref:DUF3995 domain-containing protein n=1 Tax=Pseudomonas purpurea TaxID=3136737 RepID=UPI003267E17C